MKKTMLIVLIIIMFIVSATLLIACNNSVEYTITFEVDGVSYHTVKTIGNTIIDVPQEPEKEGYGFGGWFLDKDTWEELFINSSLLEAPINRSVTVYALWIEDIVTPTYTITFDSNSGSAIDPITSEASELISAPTSPTKIGYTFDGWFTDNTTFLDAYIFAAMPEENLILYAKWSPVVIKYPFTLDFEVDEIVISINANSSLLRPPPTLLPEREGYVFDDWYIDEDYTALFDFATLVTGAITIYGKWLPIITISFESNGGLLISGEDTQSVVQGNTCIAPEYERDGYAFVGWYYDDTTFLNEHLFSTSVLNNTTLYAKWNINQYTISFESNDGSAVGSITVNYLDTIDEPEVPIRVGYNFLGWYTDDDTFLNDYVFDTKVTGCITLYANWSIIQYTISFESNDGSTVADIIIDHNSVISIPDNPQKLNHIFAGWFLDDVTFNEPANILLTQPVLDDITLYAKWIINSFTVTFSLGGGELFDGQLIQTIDYGAAALAPTINRAGYEFIDWDGTWDSITSDITLYPIWDNVVFEYTFDQGKVTITGLKGSFTDNTLIVPEQLSHLGQDREIIAIAEEAFKDNSFLTSVYIPSSIAQIGRGVLKGCDELITLEVPFVAPYNADNHSYIRYYFGGYAYNDYSANVAYSQKITTISISEGTVAIGENAFSNFNLSSLKDIYLPESLIAIETCAFENCIYIERVHFGSGIQSIGENTFYGCESLNNIILPEGFLSIGNGAFSGCRNLSNISLPSTLTTLGTHVFNDCLSLTSITIPSNITELSNYLFYNSSALEELTIQGNITKIGDYTFHNCTSLNAIYLSSTLTEIGSYAFNNCSSLITINIPASVNTIKSYAFKGVSAEVSFHPDSLLNQISAYAFSGYKGTGLNIPQSVTSIGNYAFEYCDNFASFEIPKFVTSIGTYAFRYTTGEITFASDNQITNIGNNTFRNFSGTSVVLPQSVTSIGNYAFSGCSNLTNFTIHADLIAIGQYAFNGVLGAVSFASDWNGTSLGNHAFRGYLGDSLTLPDSITLIGSEAFRDCSNLVSIILPANLITLGTGAFQNCSSLTSITIPNGVTEIKINTFENCTNLESVTLSDTLSIIGTAAFANCSSLNEIALPQTLFEIGNMAFKGCTNLESISMRSDITFINTEAFKDCTSLQSVTVLAETPPVLGGNAFDNTHSELKIYVPSASVDDYKNEAGNWFINADKIYAIVY